MDSFQPENKRYEQAVRQILAETTMAARLSVELIDIKPGLVSAKMPLTPDVMQQHGYAHAGALATLADMVCGLAAFSLMGENDSVMSTNINLSLMRPGDSDWLLGRGRVIKAGKRIFFTEADLMALDDAGERLIARATASMIRVSEQPEQ